MKNGTCFCCTWLDNGYFTHEVLTQETDAKFTFAYITSRAEDIKDGENNDRNLFFMSKYLSSRNVYVRYKLTNDSIINYRVYSDATSTYNVPVYALFSNSDQNERYLSALSQTGMAKMNLVPSSLHQKYYFAVSLRDEDAILDLSNVCDLHSKPYWYQGPPLAQKDEKVKKKVRFLDVQDQYTARMLDEREQKHVVIYAKKSIKEECIMPNKDENVIPSAFMDDDESAAQLNDIVAEEEKSSASKNLDTTVNTENMTDSAVHVSKDDEECVMPNKDESTISSAFMGDDESAAQLNDIVAEEEQSSASENLDTTVNTENMTDSAVHEEECVMPSKDESAIPSAFMSCDEIAAQLDDIVTEEEQSSASKHLETTVNTENMTTSAVYAYAPKNKEKVSSSAAVISSWKDITLANQLAFDIRGFEDTSDIDWKKEDNTIVEKFDYKASCDIRIKNSSFQEYENALSIIQNIRCSTNKKNYSIVPRDNNFVICAHKYCDITTKKDSFSYTSGIYYTVNPLDDKGNVHRRLLHRIAGSVDLFMNDDGSSQAYVWNDLGSYVTYNFAKGKCVFYSHSIVQSAQKERIRSMFLHYKEEYYIRYTLRQEGYYAPSFFSGFTSHNHPDGKRMRHWYVYKLRTLPTGEKKFSIHSYKVKREFNREMLPNQIFIRQKSELISDNAPVIELNETPYYDKLCYKDKASRQAAKNNITDYHYYNKQRNECTVVSVKNAQKARTEVGYSDVALCNSMSHTLGESDISVSIADEENMQKKEEKAYVDTDLYSSKLKKNLTVTEDNSVVTTNSSLPAKKEVSTENAKEGKLWVVDTDLYSSKLKKNLTVTEDNSVVTTNSSLPAKKEVSTENAKEGKSWVVDTDLYSSKLKKNLTVTEDNSVVTTNSSLLAKKEVSTENAKEGKPWVVDTDLYSSKLKKNLTVTEDNSVVTTNSSLPAKKEVSTENAKEGKPWVVDTDLYSSKLKKNLTVTEDNSVVTTNSSSLQAKEDTINHKRNKTRGLLFLPRYDVVYNVGAIAEIDANTLPALEYPKKYDDTSPKVADIQSVDSQQSEIVAPEEKEIEIPAQNDDTVVNVENTPVHGSINVTDASYYAANDFPVPLSYNLENEEILKFFSSPVRQFLIDHDPYGHHNCCFAGKLPESHATNGVDKGATYPNSIIGYQGAYQIVMCKDKILEKYSNAAGLMEISISPLRIMTKRHWCSDGKFFYFTQEYVDEMFLLDNAIHENSVLCYKVYKGLYAYYMHKGNGVFMLLTSMDINGNYGYLSGKIVLQGERYKNKRLNYFKIISFNDQVLVKSDTLYSIPKAIRLLDNVHVIPMSKEIQTFTRSFVLNQWSLDKSTAHELNKKQALSMMSLNNNEDLASREAVSMLKLPEMLPEDTTQKGHDIVAGLKVLTLDILYRKNISTKVVNVLLSQPLEDNVNTCITLTQENVSCMNDQQESMQVAEIKDASDDDLQPETVSAKESEEVQTVAENTKPCIELSEYYSWTLSYCNVSINNVSKRLSCTVNCGDLLLHDTDDQDKNSQLVGYLWENEDSVEVSYYSNNAIISMVYDQENKWHNLLYQSDARYKTYLSYVKESEEIPGSWVPLCNDIGEYCIISWDGEKYLSEYTTDDDEFVSPSTTSALCLKDVENTLPPRIIVIGADIHEALQEMCKGQCIKQERGSNY